MNDKRCYSFMLLASDLAAWHLWRKLKKARPGLSLGKNVTKCSALLFWNLRAKAALVNSYTLVRVN